MGKGQLKSRMKNLLMFLPNMVALCARLMVDSRVPRTERALFAAAIIYAIIPFDFIPDMIPFVGQVDDLFLIGLALARRRRRDSANRFDRPDCSDDDPPPHQSRADCQSPTDCRRHRPAP